MACPLTRRVQKTGNCHLFHQAEFNTRRLPGFIEHTEFITARLLQRSMVDGVPDEGILPCGQVAAAIGELKSCEQLISEIVQEAERCLIAVGARSV